METDTRSLPAAGEFYRHFKGKMYQIIGRACHSETEEEMVVYQALYGEYRWYVRPVSEFMSTVDKKKYPDSSAVYRFERVIPGAEGAEPSEMRNAGGMPEVQADIPKRSAQVSDLMRMQPAEAGSRVPETGIRKEPPAINEAGKQQEVKEPGRPAEAQEAAAEGQVRAELLLFLDAESAGEKLGVLRQIRGKLDEALMTNIELSLDLMPDEKESLERRLDLVERNLEKRVKYEGSRLR